MFLIAAQTLAETLTEAELQQGCIYPPLGTIRPASAKIAAAVAAEIYRADLATVNPQPPDLLQFVIDQQYDPTYPIYSTEK
jgi:malate dehydrogenase (oxaloacetate-decarboxylating)(NADP+)